MDQIAAVNAADVLEALESRTDRLRTLGVLRIGLFGSRVRGDPRPDSDIDLLVTLRDQSYDTYCDVLFYLEDLFNCPVDLVPEDSLKPGLRSTVLSEVCYVAGI